MKQDINVIIPFSQWEQTGSEENPKSRLLAGIIINGLHLHLEAIQVHNDGSGQKAVDVMFEDQVSNYQNIQDTEFTTINHEGRDYIIVATPYGD